MSAVVVIPVYKRVPTRAEILSFSQCLKVLGGHEIVLAAPSGLDVSAYDETAGRVCRVERFPDSFFDGIAGYNRLMTDESFYRRFAGFDYLLVHQLDAWVFSDALDAWCAKGYDYVGATWFEKFLSHEEGTEPWLCGNGGFSLRRIAKFIGATADGTARRVMESNKIWEDGTFAYALKGTPHEMRLPTAEEGIGFAFEHSPAYLYERNGRELPFGCHAWEHCQFLSFWHDFIPYELDRPSGRALSIVTEVGNDLEGLKRTADSVLAQSWRTFEWLLLDVGASAEVREYVASTLRPYLTYWGTSRTGGVSEARGVYFYRLDAGDAFCDQTILARVFGEGDRRADVVHGEWVEPPRKGVYYDHSVPKARQAVFFRRKCVRWGGLDRSLGRFAHWGLWRALERAGGTFEHVPVWIASIRGEAPPSAEEMDRRSAQRQKAEQQKLSVLKRWL